MKKITAKLNVNSVDRAIRSVNAYKNGLEAKCRKIAQRAAMLGATRAVISYSRAFYTGPVDVNVTVEKRDKGYAIIADGETVLFLEFGAGVTMGYGHPQNAQFGMGPGTYPDGKGHWNDPKGWWLPKAKGGGHTCGNPPTMGMYNAAQDIRRELTEIAREVFAE